MKSKKTINTITEEVIANGIGWVAGLLSIDVLKLFFIERKWTNAWGIFSKKTAVSGTTFSFMEWALTAVIGFAVMLLVNGFIRKKLFSKKKQVVIQPESVGSEVVEYQNNFIENTQVVEDELGKME